MFEKIRTYWNEHDMDRFVPWKRRVCEYCGYPLSEKVMDKMTASGRKRKSYCCSICYELRENNVIAD